MDNNTTLWDKCLETFERLLTEKQMKLWLHPLKVRVDEKTLHIHAPNRFVQESVQKNFFSLIEQTVMELSPGQIDKVSLSLATPLPSSLTESALPVRKSTFTSNLNESLVFDNFVEGKSNQLAKAAGQSIVANLGQYNPLYIYGGVGLGKTHLLHSIGNEIMRKSPRKRVVYLHSERFVQNMVSALRHGKMEDFKTFYRSVDALLLDDMQFFVGKERSQEEFFHTFNSLFEYKKQVVLTSDKYPKEIEGLEERLKSRLVWGNVVSIDPPDLETRVAIIHSKAELSGANIPDDVAFFLAKNIYSNVRELEGCLRRVLATSHFKREAVTLDFVKEALRDLLSLQERQLTIEHIQKAVATYYKIRVSDLLSSKRDRRVTMPRHMAMYLSKELTSHSLPSIGDAFGGRDHTTVLHACKKISALKETSSSIEQDCKNLIHSLNN